MNPDNIQPNQGPNPESGDHNVDGIIQPTESVDENRFFQPTVQPNFEQGQVPITGNQQQQPQGSNQQLGVQPTNGPETSQAQPTKPKSKLALITAIAVGILLIVSVVAVLVPGGSKKQPAKNTDDSSQQENVGPQPASALDVEQSNNSINQDISTLSDQEDFPETQIDDKSLGL